MERATAAYLRISRDTEGLALGVQRQREDCLALAARLGLGDVEVIEENDVGASTRSRKKRPKFEDMMRRAEAGEIGTILAYSNSRLTRRPMEFERLLAISEGKQRVKIHTVVSGSVDLSTADGRMIARILAANDAAEAERIAERVSRASRQRAEMGEFHGGSTPPFGYRIVKHPVSGKSILEVDEERAALVREAATRLLAGDTLYGVCNDWNARGLTTSTGAHWRSKTLRNALLSQSAVGRTKAGTVAWAPVLPDETWHRLGSLLSDPGRKFQAADGRYAGKRTMGGGLTVCALCGKKLVSQVHRGKVRLICHKQATGGCGVVTIQHDWLEEYVTSQVFIALDSPEVHAALGQHEETGEEGDLRSRLIALDGEAKRAYEAFVKGWATEDQFLTEKTRVETEREAVEKRLVELATAGVVGSLDNIRDGWDQRPPLARRAILSAIVREVRVGRFPEGVASTLTPFRGEDPDALAKRRKQHSDAVLDQRVEIVWRV